MESRRHSWLAQHLRKWLRATPRIVEPVSGREPVSESTGEDHTSTVARRPLDRPVVALCVSGLSILGLGGLAWGTSGGAPTPVRHHRPAAPRVISLSSEISVTVPTTWAVSHRWSAAVSLSHRSPTGWAFFGYEGGLPADAGRALTALLDTQSQLRGLQLSGHVTTQRIGERHFDAAASAVIARATLAQGAREVPVIGEAAELLSTKARTGVFVLILADDDKDFTHLYSAFRSMILSVQS